MSNEEVYKNLEVIFSEGELSVFCEVNSAVHEMLAVEDCENQNLPSEHLYEFVWWNKKLKELENGS